MNKILTTFIVTVFWFVVNAQPVEISFFCQEYLPLAQFKYPIVRKQAFDTVIYTIKLSDEYGWMSSPENKKEMEDYARLQGKFKESMLDSITGTEIIYGIAKRSE